MHSVFVTMSIFDQTMEGVTFISQYAAGGVDRDRGYRKHPKLCTLYELQSVMYLNETYVLSAYLHVCPGKKVLFFLRGMVH